MMIYTPGRGSVNRTSQYLTAITIVWQHPVHPKLHYDPKRQLMKRGARRESHEKIPQKIPLSQMDHMTKETFYHDTQPVVDTSVEQLYPTPTNPRSSKYDLRHNPKPNCNDDYRY